MTICRFLVVLLVGAIAGCAGTSTMPVCPAPQSLTTDYIIGAGDSLEIFVWRNPEVSTTVLVRPDGRISTPLVEDMTAAGKTPTRLARDMETVLSEYLVSPTVNVIIDSPGQSNLIQAVGALNAPQGVSYRESITVLDVVLTAGGLGEFAAGNRATISRSSDGSPVECSVNLEDLMRGDLSQNIRMFPGDVLIVPASRF